MTILYVNGDSHTAAAEAVNQHAFAEDDGKLGYMARAPHPDNLAVSWGRKLADLAKCSFHCGAESASSNARIIRTTKQWVAEHDCSDAIIIIQWSTWEREEWLIDNTYYQVNASGIDIVPKDSQRRYKEFVANVDWDLKTDEAHTEIYEFHCWLQARNIKHLFFNGNSHFGRIAYREDWNNSYLEPYNQFKTFDYILTENDFDKVTVNSYHYSPEAHDFWAQHILKHLLFRKFL